MDDMAKWFYKYASEYNAKREFIALCELFDGQTLDNRSIENTEPIKTFIKLLMPDDKDLIYTLKKGTELYRSRKLLLTDENLNNISYDKVNDALCGFDSYDSKEPPITVAGDGRCNISGASYLYLAGDEYTACAEICPENFGIMSVAKFKTKQDMRIFDLTVDRNFDKYNDSKEPFSVTPIISLIMQKFYLPVTNRKEYLISQYFSDLIRKYGFNGVRYLSSKTFGSNYTIFTSGENYIEFESSQPVINHITKLELYRINDSSKIEPNAHDKFAEFTSGDIEKIKSNLSKKIRRQRNGQTQNAHTK